MTDLDDLPEERTPSVVNPMAVVPPCPPALIVVGSTLLCALQGAMTNYGKPEWVRMDGPETMFGAIAGFVIGLVLAVDHWWFARKLRMLVITASDDPDAPLQIRNPGDRPSEWAPIVMIFLPIASGALAWFAGPLRLNSTEVTYLGSIVVVATAILGYVSARQIRLRCDRHSTYHGAFASPGFVYLGMLFFWIVGYPVHFVTRWRMGGRNLILPALFATAVYVSPILVPFLVEPELPSADETEVLSLVKQIVEREPMARPVVVTDPVETSFDPALQARLCECVISTKFGVEKARYKIDWQDRSQGMWQVLMLDRLPLVDAPEVLGLLQEILEDDWILRANRNDLGPLQIRLPTQTQYDPARQQRTGSAIVRTQKGDVPVTFQIQWHQLDRRQFNVQVFGAPP
jgi:hypothetical protein